MSYSMRIVGAGTKKNKVLQSLNASKFNECVTDLIVDVSHLKIRSDKLNKRWNISIIQDAKEASDIIDFFKERFKKRYSTKTNSKFVFVDYVSGCRNGEKVSMVIFYYKPNLFERKLF